MKILLMGNPNVGKSVIFSRLTGAHVIASNYPGTTVEFTKGHMRLRRERIEVIDVPGTYTLKPTSKAEEVAVEMLREAKENSNIVINIVDATNLERNLNLTLQLLKEGIKVIVCLNLWDETKHTGIEIDVKKLEEILGVPVVPTCAISGEGIAELIDRLPEAKANTYEYDEEERWTEIGGIIEETQRVTHRHHTFLDRLGDASIRPATGIPIALVVLAATFSIIRFIGESLIAYIFEPIFEGLWKPLMVKFSTILGSGGFIHDILIGKLFFFNTESEEFIKGVVVTGKMVAGNMVMVKTATDGVVPARVTIDFVQSMGLFTTGLFVPLAMVLPYIFAFYLMLSFLEDSGYLPRLGVLVDNFMHRLGLHGLSIIPMMLGLGCNVPGALATRVLETKRERFIAATLMAIAIPCMAQIAMVFGLVGKFGVRGLAPVFGTLFVVWVLLGIVMDRLLPGESPEIFTEIPPYRIPYFKALSKKLWMRTYGFLREAVPYVLLGVFIVNVFYSLHVIEFIGRLFSPIVRGVLGLPNEAVAALIIGFLRKDIAIGMLSPLGLTMKQLIVASVVLTMYFPCVATFAVLVRELGVKDMLKATLIMIVSALLVGGALNLIMR
ncbi:ferrous iron transport protein B [candidate division WOR-3 bacterium JGI_Cruoil_03_44_89]|uniref:Ferrous iron transport protein B n=1 Tax=candidate division WOR-3 bacterium JGI_Cruoil_03_44_89 TaxID=1973748 RepID=A0A235BPV2_UNCW3|nr:MAG: ferrous iron transport protein B [candidate division WOR-3 bacterium JGI_Cruoil_03_44_89]